MEIDRDAKVTSLKDGLVAASYAKAVAVFACRASIGAPAPVEVDQALVETSLARTLSAGATETGRAAPSSTATFPPSPDPTSTPTITSTSHPLARLSRDTNCRSGPPRIYELITTVLAEQEVRILGKNAEEPYWFVEDESASDEGCWLWRRCAEVRGDSSPVPVFTPPPTPTPSSIWSGVWVLWVDKNLSQASMELSQSGNSISGTLTGSSAAYSVSGIQSEGGQTVSGELTAPQTGTFLFSWMMLDGNVQFVGYFAFDNDGTPMFSAPFCAARPGEPMPEPCQWP